VERKKTTFDARLARIEGQVRGLRRMLAEDSYCCDVLTQLTAARSALDQVAAAIAADHIKHCIIDQGGNGSHPKATARSREELLEELDTVMGRLMR